MLATESNSPPVVVDDIYTVHAGTVLNVSTAAGLLANDTDPDGDTLTVLNFSAPEHGTMSMLTDGSFVYTPEAGFVGSESLTCTVWDGTVRVESQLTILVQNDPPVVVDDTYTVHAGTVLNVGKAAGLLANDSDADGDKLVVLDFSAPEHGTMSMLTDGSFVYTPEAGYVGSESLTCTVWDRTVRVESQLTILVQNASPVVVDDTYTVLAGTVLSVDKAAGLLANDSDADGDKLMVLNFTPPSHGAMSMLTDGSFVYTPAAGFVGSESLACTVWDGTVQVECELTIIVYSAEPPVVVHLGDATGVPTTANPNAWAPYWTDARVAISHKANQADAGQAWSNATLNAVASPMLAGGDLYGGDLGVSGKNLNTSAPNQEIQGAEALRFDLDGLCTSVTVDLTRLYLADDANASGYNEAGRLQALDASGNTVAELTFVASSLQGLHTATLDHPAGFSAVVISAGAYDSHGQWIAGAYADDAGEFATAPYATPGKLHGSDFLLDSIEFELVAVIGVVSDPDPAGMG